MRNWRELDYRELPWGAKPLWTGGREHTHTPRCLLNPGLYGRPLPNPPTALNPNLRGFIEAKKSAPELKSPGGKKRSRGKKKCFREHLSRALLRSVLFLAINNKVAEANHHTSYLSPLLHHYCHHCAATDSSPTPPPTQPTPSRQLLPDNDQRRGATDPPPASDTPSHHGMPPPRGGGKV